MNQEKGAVGAEMIPRYQLRYGLGSPECEVFDIFERPHVSMDSLIICQNVSQGDLLIDGEGFLFTFMAP